MEFSSESIKRDLFLSACERNDLNLVEHLLPLGADVNCRRDNEGLSGLHIAARDNFQDLLELLLRQTGVDANITTNKNAKPLMLACFCGNENIARRLCQVDGIQVNCRTLQNLTALQGAVVRNHVGCVRALRDCDCAEVDWNVREDNGWYPVTWAVDRGLADILETILSVPQPRLDLSVTDRRGRNIGQISVESTARDRERCLELLCQDQRVDWNIPNRHGLTPLLYCIKNKKASMAITLLKNPAVDLDVQDRDGRHVEDIAMLRNMTGILSELWKFTTVRHRMIENSIGESVGSSPSLQGLSSDAVMMSLVSNNRQERLVRTLVDMLGEDITLQARDVLLSSYEARGNN